MFGTNTTLVGCDYHLPSLARQSDVWWYIGISARKRVPDAMNAKNLVISQFYFRIKFADAEQTIPGVEPIAYIGVDLFPSEDGLATRSYWFQDSVSFRLYGSAAEHLTHDDFSETFFVLSFAESSIGVDVLTLGELETAIHEANARAHRKAV